MAKPDTRIHAPVPQAPGAPAAAKEAAMDQTGAVGCLARAFWTFVGNIGLLILAGAIGAYAPKEVASWAGLLSWFDAVFWVLVVAMLAVRYVDVTHLSGQTTRGQPATLADWRRYALILCGYALALWLGAHAVGYWL